ncbi:MAG: hypothetical protein PF508_09945 [Spirochaeta sp.]|jgi:hypothetical protein|nr:hypothetical protein [Spirochaeta sp.]
MEAAKEDARRISGVAEALSYKTELELRERLVKIEVGLVSQDTLLRWKIERLEHRLARLENRPL